MEGHSSQPLAWPGAWGPLPGYRSLLQVQSRQGYVHHVQYDSKPSLSWAAGAQRTVHTTHLGESSANECQQLPMLPLMGHILPPQPQPPRTVGLCLCPFRFRHTAAPRFPMYSCSAESQPQCLTPMTLQSQIECSFH